MTVGIVLQTGPSLGSQSGDGPKLLDAYAVMSVLTLAALIVAAASILAELVVVWLDPRCVRPDGRDARGRRLHARALGAGDFRILTRQLLPNALGQILVAATSVVGLIVLVDATVEFFGFGIPAAVTPSLGNLVSDTVEFQFGLGASNDIAIQNDAWWDRFFPGIVLALILVCVNVAGDALDEALHPKA